MADIMTNKPRNEVIESFKAKNNNIFTYKPTACANKLGVIGKTYSRLLGAGMPIGLLLALIYPTDTTVYFETASG